MFQIDNKNKNEKFLIVKYKSFTYTRKFLSGSVNIFCEV